MITMNGDALLLHSFYYNSLLLLCFSDLDLSPRSVPERLLHSARRCRNIRLEYGRHDLQQTKSFSLSISPIAYILSLYHILYV